MACTEEPIPQSYASNIKAGKTCMLLLYPSCWLSNSRLIPAQLVNVQDTGEVHLLQGGTNSAKNCEDVRGRCNCCRCRRQECQDGRSLILYLLTADPALHLHLELPVTAEVRADTKRSGRDLPATLTLPPQAQEAPIPKVRSRRTRHIS